MLNVFANFTGEKQRMLLQGWLSSAASQVGPQPARFVTCHGCCGVCSTARRCQRPQSTVDAYFQWKQKAISVFDSYPLREAWVRYVVYVFACAHWTHTQSSLVSA